MSNPNKHSLIESVIHEYIPGIGDLYVTYKVDPLAELYRKTRELKGFDKRWDTAYAKIVNQSFLDKAPEHIVDQAWENFFSVCQERTAVLIDILRLTGNWED